MAGRKPVLSVTLADCRVDHFRAGGKGGQNQNKRDTGCRITHLASGAVGEARDERSQLQNKKAAFRRMADTPKFKAWLRLALGHVTLAEVQVAEQMRPRDIKTEVLVDGQWTGTELPTPDWWRGQ